MHTKTLRRIGLMVGVMVVGAGTAWGVRTAGRSMNGEARNGEPRVPYLTRAELREQDIAFWAARVARDTLGAEDRTQLAALYLARASSTGYEDHVRAEQLARASLTIRRARNGKAAALLANALLAQHRFTEAYQVAAELDSLDPGLPEYRALRGEMALELGRYAEADSLFQLVVRQESRAPSVTARLSRWHELSGRPENAERLLENALRSAKTAANAFPEDGAWFHLRLADFAMRRGDDDAAATHLAEGLRAAPDDQRLRDARGRLALQERDWSAAIAVAEQSIARTPEPDMFALVSDAYAGAGDTTRAQESALRMRMAALNDTGPWHRSWTLFLLDHGLEVRAMLDRAATELQTRRDVQGYEIFAWALYKSGDDDGALAAARMSLGRGVRDPELYLRAATIAKAAGQADEAARYEHEARRINPRYRPRWRSVPSAIGGERVAAKSR